MKKISQLWKSWSEDGLRWPFVHDPVTNKPSITIMFPYITFVLMFISIILLHLKPGLIIATSVTIVVWVLSVVFYMIRKLHKASIDLDDQSISLERDSGSD